MATAPNRSRAKRTFSSLANQLYPEDDSQQSVTEEPEEDAADEQDGAAGESPVQPMSQKEMADKIYPNKGQGDQAGQQEDASEDAANAQDDGGSEDEEGPEEDDPGDEDDPAQGEKGQAAENAASRLHAVLGMFGVKPSSGQNPKEAEGAARLEAGVRKAIADAEASKGAPLTPAEEENITLGYVGDHVIKWLPLRKHDPDLMVKNMWAGVDDPKYKGKCATRFREAFEAAGGNSTGHPLSAKDWGPTLEKNGYENVSAKNYQPQNGDVRIISGVPPKDPKHPKAGETHGHIEVYDAEHSQWVSEHKDGPDGFSPKQATIAVYRFNPF